MLHCEDDSQLLPVKCSADSADSACPDITGLIMPAGVYTVIKQGAHSNSFQNNSDV